MNNHEDHSSRNYVGLFVEKGEEKQTTRKEHGVESIFYAGFKQALPPTLSAYYDGRVLGF